MRRVGGADRFDQFDFERGDGYRKPVVEFGTGEESGGFGKAGNGSQEPDLPLAGTRMARAGGLFEQVVGKEDVAGAGPGPVGVRHPEERQEVVVAERSIGGGDQRHPPQGHAPALNPSATGFRRRPAFERAAVQQPPDALRKAPGPARERPGRRGVGRLPERLEHGFLDLAAPVRGRFEEPVQEVEERLDRRLESHARIA